MNGKKTVKTAAIALLCASLGAVAAGCDSLIKTDNESDISRVVATVDIAREKDFASGIRIMALDNALKKPTIRSSNTAFTGTDAICIIFSASPTKYCIFSSIFST